MTMLAWEQAIPAAGLIPVIAAEALASRQAGHATLTTRAAAAWASVYVSLAVLFGLGTGVAHGWTAAGQFYAGYLTEYSLSLDNLFIFYVIMTRLVIPPDRQRRVLMAGIAFALVVRSVLITAGTTVVTRYDWLFYPLGAFLIWTAAGMIADGGQPGEQHVRLLSWLRGRAGPDGSAALLVLAAAIGVADLLFAFDSIPAVLGITTSATLIVACNVFALMGLRQLYVLLTGVLGRLAYLNQGLAVICAFIGVKLLLHALHGSGVRWAPDIQALPSVIIVAAILLGTVAAGLIPVRRSAVHPAAQRMLLDRRFAVLDTARTGAWCQDDYEQQARQVCGATGHAVGSAPAKALAAAQRDLFSALLAHMDANGDHQITPEEFAASVGRPVHDQAAFDTAVAATATALVRAADTDGNGVLDPGEYARLAAAYGASTGQAAHAFRRLDLDRNGVLDTAELTWAIRQFFTSPDPATPGNLAFGTI